MANQVQGWQLQEQCTVGTSLPKSCSVFPAAALPRAGRDTVSDWLLASLLHLPTGSLGILFSWLLITSPEKILLRCKLLRDEHL